MDNKRITVLHFVYTLFGGVANVAANLINYQHSLGYKTVIVYCEDSEIMQQHLDFNCEKMRAPMKGLPSESMLFGMHIKKVYSQYCKKNPNEFVIVHAHNVQAVGALGRIKNIPLICTLHGFNGHIKSLRQVFSDALYKKAIKTLLKYNKPITSVCTAIKNSKQLEKIKGKEKIVTIHNTAEMEGIEKIPHELFNIGHVGDLSSAKGWDTTWNAYCLLPKEYQENIRFYSTGNERQFTKDWIENECEQKDIQGQVIYEGYVKDARKNFIPKLDILILSSRNEGFAIVQVEAMALGIPVIGRDIGGTCECLQDGYNGFVIKDEYEIRDKIIEVYNDRRLYQTLSQNAITTYNTYFSPKVIMQKYQAIYENVINGLNL